MNNYLKSLTVFITQVDRYLRKLDQELSKFKMELEADHAGITEVLEKSKKRYVSLLFWKTKRA